MAYELRKRSPWHPFARPLIGAREFFGANLTQAITCYWQSRRNRDSISFDEWIDLDLCKPDWLELARSYQDWDADSGERSPLEWW
jgi:hypothetical protein